MPDSLSPLSAGPEAVSRQLPDGSFPSSEAPWSGWKRHPLGAPSPSRTAVFPAGNNQASSNQQGPRLDPVLSAFRSLGEAGCALPALLASVPRRADSSRSAGLGPDRAAATGRGVRDAAKSRRPCFFPGCQFSTRSWQKDEAYQKIEEEEPDLCRSCQVASFCCTQCLLSARQVHEGVECELLRAIRMTEAAGS